MPKDGISILDTIKQGDVSASLFTTFNANLKFYEDLVLRRLVAAGCRNNVLMMDARQCAMACASAATRPQVAGVAYTLIPVAVPGTFHPKICMLAGDKHASLFVGSHNLTISGFGYNREVTNHLRLGARGTPDRGVLAHAWSVAKEWMTVGSNGLPEALIDSALLLDAAFGTTPAELPPHTPELLTQQPNATALLDQLSARAPDSVTRITVVGAFFDRDAAFLEALYNRWPAAELVVGIDPDSVWMPTVPNLRSLKVVDAGDFGEAGKNAYLHAKLLYLEGPHERALLATGSANPSGPAWLDWPNAVNVEAMLVRIDADAKRAARALGLQTLASRSRVDARRLSEVTDRSKTVDAMPAMPPPAALLIAIADHEGRRIVLGETSASRQGAALAAVGQDDAPVPDVGARWRNAQVIDVSGDLESIRALLIRDELGTETRVLVHHPAIISNAIRSSSRTSASSLLHQLTSDDADISRVLPLIEKVIFSDTVGTIIRPPMARTSAGTAKSTDSTRPESLGIHLADVPRRRGKSLFSGSHDLASLIEILTKRIEIAECVIVDGFDREGRSEEERVGRDDESSLFPAARSAEANDDDVAIADAVSRRVAKLCRRMAAALDSLANSEADVVRSLVQVIAVLALVQELAHLELADRWRMRRLALFDAGDLEEVVVAAVDGLLGPDDDVLVALGARSSEPVEEATQFLSLLLWALWFTGFDWWTPSRSQLDVEETAERAASNRCLFPVLAMVGENSLYWDETRSYIERTLRLDAIERADADRWLTRQAAIARDAQALCDFASVQRHDAAGPPIAVGDIVAMPGIAKRPLVVVGADDRYVHVHWSGDEPKKYQADRVVWLASL